MDTIYIVIEASGQAEERSEDVLYYGLSIEECEAWITSKLPTFPARIYFTRKAGEYSFDDDWYYIVREIDRLPTVKV